MDPGKISPIVTAISDAEAGTTGEIRVHLSKQIYEKDPVKRAERLFQAFGMSRTAQRNAVLLYINMRRKKFALVGDRGFSEKVPREFWEQFNHELKDYLLSTQSENAIALAIAHLGRVMKKHFPGSI